MNSIRDIKDGREAYGTEIRTIQPEDFPFLLKEAVKIMKDPPDRLFIRGDLPPGGLKFLTIVGSRKNTAYGKAACEALIAGLRGLPVVIISGLAYGIDSIAHEAALKNNLMTIAVPGSGLADGTLYPAAHQGLAHRILAAGGCLVSPFEATTMGNDWTFPYRNAVMAGMSHAVLVIEAAKRSGTLITANRAIDFDRDLYIVPGSIFSETSRGPFKFIQDGARPITCADDLVEALGFDPESPRAMDRSDLSEDELGLIDLLDEPLPHERLFETLGIGAARLNALISSLEMKGFIKEERGFVRRRFGKE